MLKRNITYTNFDGEEVTELFYFNLSKTELVDLEINHEFSFRKAMQNIIDAKDNRSLMKEFKQIILLSYGQKSPDGRSFIKNDELREAFQQTAAFDALYMEFVISDTAAADFINGIVPADLLKEVEQMAANGAARAVTDVQSSQTMPPNPATTQFPPIPSVPLAHPAPPAV